METAQLTLNALFDRSVARRGDALAVKDVNGGLSYRTLSARAASLARQLRGRGIERGDRVVLYSERTVHAIVAAFGVLEAGGVLVPVGLDTPPERLDAIASDATPRVLLADRTGLARLRAGRRRLDSLSIEELSSSDATSGEPVVVTPGDLAYIIYTSGTCGQPKGVMIEHGSIANRFRDWDVAFDLTSSPTRCLQIAKLGFDVFVGDVVKALCSGGVLVLCPTEVVLEPARLHQWLVDESIDYLDIVPAVLRSLVDYLESSGQSLSSVRIINCGADVWTKADYARARRIMRAGRLFNGYGVSECTVESTLFEDDGTTLDSMETLPLGRPLASDTILVVDEALVPVPAGVAGEICVGGPCVARGYLNRPELNERAFFLRAAGEGEPTRFYRTGDRGRVDANGVLEFLGRMDAQVKINGHRIELDEVEHVLERVAAISQAVVCVDARQPSLVAFVRTVDGTPIDPAGPAACLARHLPSYMIPSRILTVREFPLTQNGKVDRARLASDPGFLVDTRAKHAVSDLENSRSADELRERLEQLDIDPIGLVREFVKPFADFGLVVRERIADGTGATAGLALMVLLEEASAMKARKSHVAGNRVEHRPGTGAARSRILVTVEGVEVTLDFLIATNPSARSAAAQELSGPVANWTLHGHDVVERWRRDWQAAAI